jgi:hypothetical protein
VIYLGLPSPAAELAATVGGYRPDPFAATFEGFNPKPPRRKNVFCTRFGMGSRYAQSPLSAKSAS